MFNTEITAICRGGEGKLVMSCDVSAF